ncbi:MAG TPA: isocitrate lyase, partial [Chloroflexota bacterium]
MTLRTAPRFTAEQLAYDWQHSPRWRGITRRYSAADVVRLQGSLQVEYTLATRGARRLWELLNTEPYVPTLGALTGNQAVQQVKA